MAGCAHAGRKEEKTVGALSFLLLAAMHKRRHVDSEDEATHRARALRTPVDPSARTIDSVHHQEHVAADHPASETRQSVESASDNHDRDDDSWTDVSDSGDEIKNVSAQSTASVGPVRHRRVSTTSREADDEDEGEDEDEDKEASQSDDADPHPDNDNDLLDWFGPGAEQANSGSDASEDEQERENEEEGGGSPFAHMFSDNDSDASSSSSSFAEQRGTLA